MPFSTVITLYSGFTHAMETDHLLAVGNIVTNRNTLLSSVKDGISWGLGHTTTILFIGICTILFQMNIPPHYFEYFEALVGLMLAAMGTYRLVKFSRARKAVHHHHQHHNAPGHTHAHTATGPHLHKAAYGVGLVHGLAGSGALILVVITQIKDPWQELFYLLLFGLGSVLGMLVAAGLLSFPFTKKILGSQILQTILILLSGSLCILYGGYTFYQHLIA